MKDVILDYIKGPINKILQGIESSIVQIATNKILEYQVEEYNRNLFSKTILHRATPKNLFEFYQPLHLTENKNSKNLNRIETENIKKLFDSRQYLTIIGTAGSGKSTLVKYLFIKCIDEKYKIPIKIELRYLNNFDGTLIDYVKNMVFKFQDLADNEIILESMLTSDKFLFFFDGYDELSSLIKQSTTKQIDDFVKKYNKNSYILTSRPYTGIEMLPLFHNFFVEDLTDDQIKDFIRKQIPATEIEVIDKLIEAIENKDNQSYNQFIRNPLLLSMFILTFQSYASIPQKKTIYYRQVFDTLYSHHDSMSKLAFVREKQSGLSKEDFESVLILFSFLSYFDEKYIFDITYFQNTLSKIKEKKKNLIFDVSNLINDLQIAIGVINKEGLDYTFPHRSLQEYFAAVFISDLNPENKLNFYKKIREKVFSDDMLYFIQRDNFFSILKELDLKDLVLHLVIPNIEKIEDSISKVNYKNQKSVYVEWRKIALITMFFIPESELSKECNKEYLSEYHQGIPIGKIKDTKHFEEALFKELIELVKKFERDIQTIIKKLKDLVIEDDKGDEEIIDLI